jgi:hypothetical protein
VCEYVCVCVCVCVCVIIVVVVVVAAALVVCVVDRSLRTLARTLSSSVPPV